MNSLEKLKSYVSNGANFEHVKEKKDKEKTKKTHSVMEVNYSKVNVVLSILLTCLITGILLFTVANLPQFGSAENPAINEVVERYVEDGMYETGAVNTVTGMILDYRAFDTFGESNVLFLAVICVIILLRRDKFNYSKTDEEELEEDEEILESVGSPILRVFAGFLFPIIVLFGIYVILNGHLSPGGGFSGGAIIGAGLIMYSSAFGFERTSKFMNYKVFTVISFCCLMTYGSLKIYSFFTGANHLPSIIGPGIIGNIISSGVILPLNICVGLIVSCTMYGFYALFTKGDI